MTPHHHHNEGIRSKADGFCTTNKHRDSLLISMCKADLFKYEYVAYSQILVTAALWHVSLFALLLKIVILSLDFFQMPHLQVVFAPPTPSLLVTISSILQGISCSGRYQPSKVCVVSQKPEITSLSSPKVCALFSLLSSLSFMLTGRGARHSFKVFPMSALKREVVSKGAHAVETAERFLWDQIVIVAASPSTEKSVIFSSPSQPTACYWYTLETKPWLEELTHLFSISSFSLYIYIQMKHQSQIQGDPPWVGLLPELTRALCLQLWKGAYPTQETSSSEKTHNVKSKHFWFPPSAIMQTLSKSFFWDRAIRSSWRSRLFWICPFCTFLTLRAQGGPHACSSSYLWHEYPYSSRQILVQDQGFAHQGCGTSTTVLLWQCTMVWVCCHSDIQKVTLEIKGRFPMHDSAGSAPRNSQTASADHELQSPSVRENSKRHFHFCSRCTCTSGNPRCFTVELLSLLC